MKFSNLKQFSDERKNQIEQKKKFFASLTQKNAEEEAQKILSQVTEIINLHLRELKAFELSWSAYTNCDFDSLTGKLKATTKYAYAIADIDYEDAIASSDRSFSFFKPFSISISFRPVPYQPTKLYYSFVAFFDDEIRKTSQSYIIGSVCTCPNARQNNINNQLGLLYENFFSFLSKLEEQSKNI